MSLAYRPAEEADHRLIFNSWLESYRTAHAAGLIQMPDWTRVMLPQLQKIVDRPGVTVLVAYHPQETDKRSDLYGWIAVEREYEVPLRRRERVGDRVLWTEKIETSDRPLVHYVYTKENYRRYGLARGLFKAAGIDPTQPFNYTCKTGVVSKLARKIPKATWTPLIARHPKKEKTSAKEETREESREGPRVEYRRSGTGKGTVH